MGKKKSEGERRSGREVGEVGGGEKVLLVSKCSSGGLTAPIPLPQCAPPASTALTPRSKRQHRSGVPPSGSGRRSPWSSCRNTLVGGAVAARPRNPGRLFSPHGGAAAVGQSRRPYPPLVVPWPARSKGSPHGRVRWPAFVPVFLMVFHRARRDRRPIWPSDAAPPRLTGSPLWGSLVVTRGQHERP